MNRLAAFRKRSVKGIETIFRALRGLDKKKTLLAISFAIVVVFFLLTRMPYFLHYPVPLFANDSYSYHQMAQDIGSGKQLNLSYRTPGYPLFIAFIFIFSNKVLAVVFAQHVLTLLASLLMVYAVYKLSPRLAPFSAVAMAAFFSGNLHAIIDCTYRPDGVYANFLIISFALLFLAIRTKRGLYFISASAAMGYTIYIRPAGMFLTVIFLLVTGYLYFNRFGLRTVIAFTVPFVSLLLLLCTYNYITLDTFTVSPFGERNLIMVTLVFTEEDPSYPPEINRIIKERRDKISDKDKEILYHSWDLKSIQGVLGRNWNASRVTVREFLTLKDNRYMAQRPLLRKLSRDAIIKHPGVYLKLFASNLYYYFKRIKRNQLFYQHLNRSYNSRVVNKKHSPFLNRLPEKKRKDFLREYHTLQPLPYFKLTRKGNKDVAVFIDTPLRKIHSFLTRVQGVLFRNLFWVFAYFITFGLSVFFLIRSRGRHAEAFLLFILTLSVLGAALIISLVSRPIYRYAYVTEFVYYLGLTMLPLLWRTDYENR